MTPAASSSPPAAPDGHTWLGLVDGAVPDGVESWAALPSCGAVVSFRGTVRDVSEGREGVELLTYEAYEEAASGRLAEVADEARRRWPDLGRVAVLHRVGALEPTEVAVLVVVAAPHREASFAAARWLIDAVKASVPIWKHERWAGGEGWGLGSQPTRPPAEVPVPTGVVPT